jgi:hypothetical protein
MPFMGGGPLSATPANFENQFYMFGLFDIGADNGCHLHHIDGLTYFQLC